MGIGVKGIYRVEVKGRPKGDESKNVKTNLIWRNDELLLRYSVKCEVVSNSAAETLKIPVAFFRRPKE